MCERAEPCKKTVDRPAQGAEDGRSSSVCHNLHEADLTQENEATPPETLEGPCMDDSMNHNSLLSGSADAQVDQKVDGVCEDTNDLPITPSTTEPSTDGGETESKCSQEGFVPPLAPNSKAGDDSDSETSGMPDLLRNLLRKANPEWRRKDLVSVEAKLAKVGVHTVDAFVEALHGRLNEGLRAAGLKTFNAETIRALRKCACGDKSMEKSVIQPQPRAVATIGISTVETLSGSPEMNAPPETLEVSSADKAINRNSLSSGAADAQAEEKPDGAHGDTDDLYQ